jgi:hypothetical protein
MTADYAALEARVAELEHQMRHILPPKIDAVAYGLSLVHEDLRTFREKAEPALDRMEARLDRHGELLGSLTDQVAEILRRLPEQPA